MPKDPITNITIYAITIFLIFCYWKPLKIYFKNFFNWWIGYFLPSTFLLAITFLLVFFFGINITNTHKTDETDKFLVCLKHSGDGDYSPSVNLTVKNKPH